ncbi:MAG: hypothetical protein JSW35_05005 [Deltaproteobacteria bacterium]|nr:MAG: hypothetical protein JSW35_05005 [Deltaproteobacteria bacterium]
MESREQVLRNPVFLALEEVGHRPEDDIYIWAQGIAFHNQNLLDGMKEHVADPALRERILYDLWSYFHTVGLEKVNGVLGIEEKPHVDKINKILAAILHDKDHPAILGMGEYIEEAFLNWLNAFTIYDFSAYTYLEKHLGAKDGLRIYMGLWEKFALSALDHWKQTLGIKDPSDIDMNMLGKLSRAYWESIGIPYHVTKHSKDVHEAELGVCSYYANMKAILGEEKARSMTLKTEAATSVNYYDAILKALGVFDKFSFTMDKFQCCGDKACRVRFERRK